MIATQTGVHHRRRPLQLRPPPGVGIRVAELIDDQHLIVVRAVRRRRQRHRLYDHRGSGLASDQSHYETSPTLTGHPADDDGAHRGPTHRSRHARTGLLADLATTPCRVQALHRLVDTQTQAFSIPGLTCPARRATNGQHHARLKKRTDEQRRHCEHAARLVHLAINRLVAASVEVRTRRLSETSSSTAPLPCRQTGRHDRRRRRQDARRRPSANYRVRDPGSAASDGTGTTARSPMRG